MKKRRWNIKTAFMLMEALLAATILAMAVVAIILPFTAGAQGAAQDARLTLAVDLAQDMMEEILAKPFSDPGGTEAGEGQRSTWDDMADYNNHTEAEGHLTCSDGTLCTDPAGTYLSRRVEVLPTYVPGQDTSKPAVFVTVRVTVKYHGLPIVTLSRLVYANS